MARLIMWNLMTLDGYMEGPGRDLSWHNNVWGDELEQLSIEQGKSAGGLLFGRITYELMAGYWPKETGEIADFMNALPKFVFSRTLSGSDWTNTTIYKDDVAGTVGRLKRDTVKDIFLFGSADLAADLIAHDLIDEYRIGVCPALLGAGTLLFKPGGRHRLKLIDSKSFSTGVVISRYVPAAQD